MKRRIAAIILLVAAAAAGIGFWMAGKQQSIVLTGIVSTDEVREGALIQGRLRALYVKQGDVVKKGQLLALIQPREWQADRDYYQNAEREAAAGIDQARADLSYLEDQTREQIRRARADLAMNRDQVRQARADLDYARITFDRAKAMRAGGINSEQDFDRARTGFDAAKAHVESLEKQVLAAQAALALAQSNSLQIAARRAALTASKDHLAAARAQTEKATVRLDYTKITASIDGIVDVRAALQGEVVTPGETILTLVDPDNLWIRADVAESDIDRIHLGDRLPVRLPSGATREGTVFFRGVDADYATQRDVSRTKRDIKTFQIRLRCDNRDRSLALGMTAYVTLPLR
jgi:HlyD family secretion protein